MQIVFTENAPKAPSMKGILSRVEEKDVLRGPAPGWSVFGRYQSYCWTSIEKAPLPIPPNLLSVSCSFWDIPTIDNSLAPCKSTTFHGWQLHQALSKVTSNYLLSVLAKCHTIPVFFRETPNTVFAQGDPRSFGGVPHLDCGFRIGNPGAERATPTSR